MAIKHVISFPTRNNGCIPIWMAPRCNPLWWQTFEKVLIIVVEAGLNQGHVVLQVEPNFTLDIHKPSLTDAIKVLIQVNGLTMKPDESALAIHHTMTYKVQTHLFFMSSFGKPITRFLAGDGRVFQPRTYRQN